MQTINLKLPYTEATLLLDSLRHYIKYIDNLEEDEVCEDTHADLLNDGESLKALEQTITEIFSEEIEQY